MFFFRVIPVEMSPAAVTSERERLLARPPPRLSFTAPQPLVEDLLELRRLQDRVRQFERPSGANLAEGVSMFAAATVLAAHLPRPLNVVFEAPVHLGPAIFSEGGVGAGLGARF